jgi:predicted metalloprotease with PDZ domain
VNGQTQLATVYEGGAAHKAGLSAGDTLVAIDSLRVADHASLDRLLKAYRAGDTVTVHVFRRDELRSFTLTLAAPGDTECQLTAEASLTTYR